ncbi:MAG TPA: phospholipase D-like domain-containing protein, partial [Polyangiaceae bacterium]|nr:phospholipase D-like domain-containing protein [Polyangiaceae bacterium]
MAEVVDNVGPNQLVTYLRDSAKTAVAMDIAAAFVTASGLNALLHALLRVAGQGKVRLLTGLFQGVTEPAALRKLLQAESSTQGGLAVRISRDAHFHWKAYFIARRTKHTMVIGSSNLTSDGLRRTGELNIIHSVPADRAAREPARQAFERAWKAATPLRAPHIERYEELRGETLAMSTPNIPVREILGRSELLVEPIERAYFRASLEGYVAKDTNSILMETTDWGKRGYEYFNAAAERYNKRDRIIFFDFTVDQIFIVEVIDLTRTPIATPDGRHFVAYRKLRGTKARRMVPTLWSAFRESGLLTSKAAARSDRKLSLKQWDEFRN